MSSPVILLAAEPELRDVLATAGFDVLNIDPTRPAELDPRAVVLVFDVADLRAATARTRQWRAEHGDALPPVIWVLNEASKAALAAGLDAGADACLLPPFDPAVLIAQVHAAVRSQARTARFAARAEEARGLNDRLQKAFEATASDAAFALSAAESARPRRLPACGSLKVAVVHRSRAKTFGQYDVARIDGNHLAVWIADVGGSDVTAGVLALLTRSLIAGREITEAGPASPASILDRVNRGLIGLDRELPFVGLAYAQVEATTGRVQISRSGVPLVLHLPVTKDAEPWGQSGPFLGAFDAVFPAFEGQLRPGERLLLTTTGEAAHVAMLAGAHRKLPNQSLGEVVADELLAHHTDCGGVTVIVVEYPGS